MWVLVVEDEPAMAALLRQGLEEDQHTVTVVHDGAEALDVALSRDVDVVVLDVMLPGLDGIAVASRLRAANRPMPILLLTARDAAVDIVGGLDAGADDYLTKPFALKVLLARLRALARRSPQPAVALVRCGDISLDPGRREVTVRDAVVPLTATEYRLFDFLIRRRNRACSRDAILDGVWGLAQELQPNTVDVFVGLLRSKLTAAGAASCIETVRGYGYILREGPAA